MPDDTGVTDAQGRPSMDDLADVLARTNAGIRALSEQLAFMQTFALLAFILLFGALSRVIHLFRVVA